MCRDGHFTHLYIVWALQGDTTYCQETLTQMLRVFYAFPPARGRKSSRKSVRSSRDFGRISPTSGNFRSISERLLRTFEVGGSTERFNHASISGHDFHDPHFLLSIHQLTLSSPLKSCIAVSHIIALSLIRISLHANYNFREQKN